MCIISFYLIPRAFCDVIKLNGYYTTTRHPSPLKSVRVVYHLRPILNSYSIFRILVFRKSQIPEQTSARKAERVRLGFKIRSFYSRWPLRRNQGFSSTSSCLKTTLVCRCDRLPQRVSPDLAKSAGGFAADEALRWNTRSRAQGELNDAIFAIHRPYTDRGKSLRVGFNRKRRTTGYAWDYDRKVVSVFTSDEIIIIKTKKNATRRRPWSRDEIILRGHGY